MHEVTWRETFAAGAASLLVELAFLRFLPGHIRVLGYFTNFVLLAAFVGLGVGMLVAHRFPKLRFPQWSGPLGIALLVGFAALGRTWRIYASHDEVVFLEYMHGGTSIPLYPFLTAAYAVIAIGFIPLGHWVGTTLAGDRPLVRYGWNVAGSLAGIAIFALVSVLALPPWVWLIVAALPLVFAYSKAPPLWRGLGVAAIAGSVLVARQTTSDATWSPYQKISVGVARVDPKRGIVSEWELPRLTPEQLASLVTLPEERGFTVRTNDDSFQTPIDLRAGPVEAMPALGLAAMQYELPYRARPPGRVLVLGAGTGNDVAAALRSGATSVDAVEIDPAILALGAKHPEHPYRDARVTTHLDDARTFLAHTDGHWDTIVYGLLDSHVLLNSSLSSVRLDSYVFTAESFAVAKSRLAPGGILVVSHAVGTPWFIQRMRASLAEAFGQPPLILNQKMPIPVGIVYVSGEQVPAGPPIEPNATILSDDWPFVYLHQRSIPREYLIAMALVAIVSLVFVRAAAGKAFRGFDAHFFFLGAAFLLLETRGLSALALLVGATWAVTSAVFAAVLVMALLATLIATRIGGANAPRKTIQASYVFLAVALAMQAAIGLSVLADFPLGARIVIGAILVALPILASGVVFGVSLARAGEADRALASNLLGAVAGGLAEYGSMIIGLHLLIALAALFYVGAFLTGRRYRIDASE